MKHAVCWWWPVVAAVAIPPLRLNLDQPARKARLAETSDPAAGTEAQPGGQVVEVGEYHLELVPAVEADSTHVDLYLQQGDSHEPIPDAQVTAQVDLPNGTQQSLEMDYDAADEHYAALLPSDAAGEYKVAVLSDIDGEKVNGRFSFNRLLPTTQMRRDIVLTD